MTTKKIQRVNFTKDSHEISTWAQGGVVCGIDEVGRGCLAGPLVTAAAILKPHKKSRLVKDSKELTEEDRYQAARWISKNAWIGYGIVHHRTIDQHNIWQSTLIAMKRALINVLTICPYKPHAILVDAMPLTLFDTNFKEIPVHHFPKGEKRSSSIAAASIMAKIKRDELMGKLDPLFPGYFLGQHKGYATSVHQKAVKELSRSIIHRQTFIETLLNSPTHDNQACGAQQSLFETQSHLETNIDSQFIEIVEHENITT